LIAMAVELYLRKLNDCLVPVDQAGADALKKFKPNSEIKCVISQPRNIGFHRKFFSLLDVAFNAWDYTEIEHKGVKIAKNRDRFRKDLTIMCGHYDIVPALSGGIRLEAKSISFANMSQDEFERLYSEAIDIILQKVLTGYTKDDLDEQVQRVLGFC